MVPCVWSGTCQVLIAVWWYSLLFTDINDNDPVFDQEAYHFSFAEDSDIGYIIGSVHANDSDIGPAGD